MGDERACAARRARGRRFPGLSRGRVLQLLGLLVSLAALRSLGGSGTALALDNGLALTPYMGWNSYYGQTPMYEEVILSVANAMVSRGLLAAGYQYVWLDDGWWDGTRDKDGNIVPPPRQWPHGMRYLTDFIHSRGLRAGIYTDAGADGCMSAGTGSGPSEPGAPDHYQQDVDRFATWGFDAIKVDFCGGRSDGLDPQTQFQKFSAAVMHNASHRPMLLNLCNPFSPFNGSPPLEQSAYWTYTFAPQIANSWRTETDVGYPPRDKVFQWADMLRNLKSDAAHPEAAGPGHWNDPDYLGPENGMTPVEDQTQFTMWAMLAAPLVIGSDVRKLSNGTIAMLTNPEVIAVDQDPRGAQGVRVASHDGIEVWSKPLATQGLRAVALLNTTANTTSISVSWQDVGLTGNVFVRDLWSHTDLGAFPSGYTMSVPGHGAALLLVSGREQ